MVYLSSISVYPIKSMQAVSLISTRIVESGALEHDREFAIFDADDKFVNGKRNPKVHLIRAIFDAAESCFYLTVIATGETSCYAYPEKLPEFEARLSAYFEMPVTIRRNDAGGFPDDKNALGPTIIGRSSLEAVTSWYDGLTYEETKRRFRANLEIAGGPEFWEDCLYGSADETIPFRIGDVQFEGTNPCQRCIVPTRGTETGEATPDFSNHFMERRKATLPAWADSSRFNHFYRFAVNTRLPATEVGKIIRVGDLVTVG